MSYNYYSSYPSASTYSKATSSSAGLDGIIAALGAFSFNLLYRCCYFNISWTMENV